MRELIINGVSVVVGEQVKNEENNNVWNIIKDSRTKDQSNQK